MYAYWESDGLTVWERIAKREGIYSTTLYDICFHLKINRILHWITCTGIRDIGPSHRCDSINHHLKPLFINITNGSLEILIILFIGLNTP